MTIEILAAYLAAAFVVVCVLLLVACVIIAATNGFADKDAHR